MAYVKKADKTNGTEVKEEVVKKKKFAPEELIPCVSITPGQLFFSGKKSGTLYTFADIDDVVEIEFRDLDYAARSSDKIMLKPRFIVQDSDFINLHSKLDDIYSALHSTSDLESIIKMTPAKMEKIIPSLPLGAKDALKIIAATMVDKGELDSLQRIKKLDELLGTELFTKLNI
nr:MAG TPA: hypothetical protein [Bacteriophage sp.]